MMEEKGKIATESKISKNPIISVDTKVVDMLKWDSEGKVLDYDTSPEGFKDLPIEVMKELSFENKSRYIIAKQLAEAEKGNTDGGWKNDITITEQYASPSERIEVKGKQDGFSYYLATPDKISKHEGRGFRVVPSGSPESIGLSGRNTIGTVGREELVLMKTTAENAAKIKAAKAEKNAKRKGAMYDHVEGVADENNIRTFGSEKNRR